MPGDERPESGVYRGCLRWRTQARFRVPRECLKNDVNVS